MVTSVNKDYICYSESDYTNGHKSKKKNKKNEKLVFIKMKNFWSLEDATERVERQASVTETKDSYPEFLKKS